MTPSGKMAGKRALVTGAGTGIGRGVAMALAHEGAAVVFHYSRSDEGARLAVDTIQSQGGKATAIQADFRELAPIDDLANQTLEFLGGIDILVNNAGITNNVPFGEITPVHFHTLINVNLRSQFFLTQALLPVMAEQKQGVVINLTSVHAYGGMTEHSVYAATKGAIVAFTREVSLELIQKGIRVNAIAPGWIHVENHEKALGEKFDWKKAALDIPTGFIGIPHDIANLVIFLASDEARYIVGQTLIADGGMLAIMPQSGDFRAPRAGKFGEGYV